MKFEFETFVKAMLEGIPCTGPLLDQIGKDKVEVALAKYGYRLVEETDFWCFKAVPYRDK
jgi:hypothetical protein